MKIHPLYLNGEFVTTAETLAVLNPSTGQPFARMSVASRPVVAQAIASAHTAFSTWRNVTGKSRGDFLLKIAAEVERRKDEIARAITMENGKPLADSHGEIDRVVETIGWCAEEGKRAYGRLMPPRAPGLSQATVKRAVGPVAAFVPWNFPIVLAARKVAAALAAGCTVVLKPAEETPASCIELVRAFVDAGLPSGVLNLVFGVPADISRQLIESPVIRKISFTGSVPVGRLLATLAAQQLKPATMELGGHAPVVVFDDVDVDKVAAECVAFKFRNAGQVCLSPSRFFVHESIADRFTTRFAELARAIKVGDGLQAGVQMGPLNNARRLEAAQALVADVAQRGGRIHAGGERLGSRGFFFAPTVMSQVAHDCRLLREEPFCPVAPVMSFSSMDEVMERANGTQMGLAAYAFTNRLDRAHEFSERIEAGWIGINNFTPALADAPIAGAKDSGLGMEGGPEGLDAYLQTRFISQLNRPT